MRRPRRGGGEGDGGRVEGLDPQVEVVGVDVPQVRLRPVRELEGDIEQLDSLDLEAGSFDAIVSNCVINLSPDKESVLREAYRLLKASLGKGALQQAHERWQSRISLAIHDTSGDHLGNHPGIVIRTCLF